MFIVYCKSRKRIMFLNEAMKSNYIQVSVLFIRYIFRAAVHRNLPEGGPENNHAGCAPAGGEYSTVQYSTVQYSTAKYSTVQSRWMCPRRRWVPCLCRVGGLSFDINVQNIRRGYFYLLLIIPSSAFTIKTVKIYLVKGV